MAKLLPYFRWYPADAESDSKYAAMTLSELGLYHRCLNHSWLNDGLHVDVSEMARELRIPLKEIKDLWPRVSACFSGVDRLRNSRQEAERSHAILKSSKSADAANIKHGKRADVVRTHSERSADVVPRAYGSVSESVFESSEEIRKGRIAEVLAGALDPGDKRLTVEELETAWERHRKHRNDQPMVNVFRMVHAQNGTLDTGKFRLRHPRWCEYWERKGWQFCSLTLWEWVEAGMPEPPPEVKNEKRSWKDDIE